MMRNVARHAALLGASRCLPPRRAADVCKLEITGNDQMQYDKKKLSVPATCKAVT